MTRPSDGTIERETAQLAAQRSAGLHQRVSKLEARCTDLQHQLWNAQADNARTNATLHTVLGILANQGNWVAQSMLAALQPEGRSERMV